MRTRWPLIFLVGWSFLLNCLIAMPQEASVEGPPARAAIVPKAAIIPRPAGRVLCVSLSADGSRLAVGSEEGGLTIWEPNSGRLLCTLRKDPPSAPLDGVDPLKLPEQLTDNWPVFAVAFDPKGSRVAAAIPYGPLPEGLEIVRPVGCEIYVWDVATGRLLSEFGGPRTTVRALAFSGSGSWLYSLEVTSRLASWDAETGRRLDAFGDRDRPCLIGSFAQWDTAFDDEARRAASVMDDEPVGERLAKPTLKLWDRDPGSLRVIESQPWAGDAGLLGVALSPDGRRLAVGVADGFVHFLDFAEVRPIGRLRIPDDAGFLALRFRPGGKQIVAVDENGLARIGDVPNGRISETTQGTPGTVRALGWYADQIRVVSGGWKLIPSKVDSTPPDVEPLSTWTIPITMP